MSYHRNICASYLILLKENKILLLLRANTDYFDGSYSLIAGHVEQGESFTECIVREAKEETEIELNLVDITAKHFLHRPKQERVDVFFVAKNWVGEVKNVEPDKCAGLDWFELNNLPSNIIPYVKQVIELVQKDIFYSEFVG